MVKLCSAKPIYEQYMDVKDRLSEPKGTLSFDEIGFAWGEFGVGLAPLSFEEMGLILL